MRRLRTYVYDNEVSVTSCNNCKGAWVAPQDARSHKCEVVFRVTLGVLPAEHARFGTKEVAEEEIFEHASFDEHDVLVPKRA